MALISVVMRGTEVNDLDRTTIVHIDQDILRFEITMCDVSTVTVRDGLQYLLCHDSCLVLSEDAALCNLFE